MGFSIYFGIILAVIGISILMEIISAEYKLVFNLLLLFIHSTILISIIFIICAITQRYYISCLLALLFHYGIIVINKAKINILQEPLVFADFTLVSQVFKYPRLYVPFVAKSSSYIYVSLFLFVVSSLFYFESALLPIFGSHLALFLGFIVFALLSAVFTASMLHFIAVTGNPDSDVKRFGLLISLVAYWYHSSRTKRKTSAIVTQNKVHIRVPKTKPHVIAIQSESFFDARRLSDLVKNSIFNNFNRIASEALYSGELIVPACGANTMRTEFSFLTGLNNKTLNFGKFNPFHYFRDCKISSNVTALKNEGYRCVCIHPYYKEFFARHKTYENLGFDSFIDIETFIIENNSTKFGPYISDKALTNKIISTLRKSKQPTFIFAITIENHGPFHLETIREDEYEQYLFKSDNNDRNLAVYLRHLKNADHMIGSISSFLSDTLPNSLLFWYGDHVPGLPDTFEKYNFKEGTSDYFIWSPLHKRLPPDNKKTISVESLFPIAFEELDSICRRC